MNFDEIIERRGTHSAKWDMMEPLWGVPAKDGIPMWVADMDFRPPQAVQDAIQRVLDHGLYGYFGDDADYRESINWWMSNRHGYSVRPEWIFSTHGLVNGTSLCVETWTEPGDGVILTTPVYYVFHRMLNASGRRVIECELPIVDGKYVLDTSTWDAQVDETTKMILLCSPHNPGGRCWTREELEEIADFARRHDLILVSDEVHQDIVLPGHKHIPTHTLDNIQDRLVTLNAVTKTFNLAGIHTGNAIIPDDKLREDFLRKMTAQGISPNMFGPHVIPAVYSPEGAAWVDEMCAYIGENARVFDSGVNAIPGLRAMPLEGTYLSWVDFSGTGMSVEDFTRRVEQDARICPQHGVPFGKGADNFLRFNIATPRSRVEEAVERLTRAFGDLQ